MKKYQHLIVTAQNQRQLEDMLERMKNTSSKVFSFSKLETANYAKTLFKEQSQVGCFKTKKADLFESRVWVIIGKEGLTVTNINSEVNGHLGITHYNHILTVFFDEVIHRFIDPNTMQCFLTGEEEHLESYLHPETYQLLNLWQDTCNKSAPISHPSDLKNWLNFLISYATKEQSNFLTMDDFSQWLSEDCHWPSGYNESIEEMAINFEYSVELLDKYKEEAHEG
jgi:hypothetical protein